MLSRRLGWEWLGTAPSGRILRGESRKVKLGGQPACLSTGRERTLAPGVAGLAVVGLPPSCHDGGGLGPPKRKRRDRSPILYGESFIAPMLVSPSALSRPARYWNRKGEVASI